MMMRGFRPKEQEARLAALSAAQEYLASTGESVTAISERQNIARGTLMQGIYVLKYGEPDEIVALKRGDYSWRILYDAVRARLGPEHMAIHMRSLQRLPRPNQYGDKRVKALAAAQAVIDHGLSYEDAAKREDVSRTLVNDAYTCLTEGTPEQIERLKSGAVALRVIHKEITSRSRAERRAVRKQVVLSNSTKDQQAMEAAIWERLRTALTNLRDLPAPGDVVVVVRKNPQRRTTTDSLLMNSFSWITEFADAWTK